MYVIQIPKGFFSIVNLSVDELNLYRIYRHLIFVCKDPQIPLSNSYRPSGCQIVVKEPGKVYTKQLFPEVNWD